MLCICHCVCLTRSRLLARLHCLPVVISSVVANAGCKVYTVLCLRYSHHVDYVVGKSDLVA